MLFRLTVLLTDYLRNLFKNSSVGFFFPFLHLFPLAHLAMLRSRNVLVDLFDPNLSYEAATLLTI